MVSTDGKTAPSSSIRAFSCLGELFTRRTQDRSIIPVGGISQTGAVAWVRRGWVVRWRDAIPKACVVPVAGTSGDRLPGTMPLGRTATESARAEYPQGATDDAPMVFGRMASMRLLRWNGQWIELQIQAEGKLELGGEGLSATGRLGARIPTGDGDSGNLRRMEAIRGRRGRASLLHPVPPAANDFHSAAYGKATLCQPSRKNPAVCQPSRKDRANLRANYRQDPGNRGLDIPLAICYTMHCRLQEEGT